MREIDVSIIKDTVARLCIEANIHLPKSLERCICEARKTEKSPVGRAVFADLADNIAAADRENIPVCQDTGMAVIFMRIGQDVHFTGGNINDAINEGVAKGYTDGYLRKSIVGDPLERVNTGDNTPAVVHFSFEDGESVRIDVCPKGFGSENMSALRMFTPSVTKDEIMDYVAEVCSKAGSNPCPPMVVGVGIGGNFESCALNAKKALCRDVSVHNDKPLYAEMEEEILKRINRLGIGPQGFGGTVTALSVAIEQSPTHIAGLPVAVNIGCHVTRHATAIL